MKNSATMLNSITNINKSDFQIAKDNGVFIDVPTAAKYAIPDNASVVTLYSFDIKTGVASGRPLVIPVAYANDSFAAALVGDWYRVQFEKAHAVWAKILSISDELSEDEKAAKNAVERRYNIVRDVCNAHEATKNLACDTVKNFVACLAKQPLKAYSASVIDAYASLKACYTAINNKNDSVSLKKFREVLNVLTGALWAESINCKEYVFNANATLAREVFQCAYNGRKWDMSGYISKNNDANERAMMSEVVLACLEDLQKKSANKKTDDNSSK